MEIQTKIKQELKGLIFNNNCKEVKRKMMEINDYNAQAKQFLKETGTEFKVKFLEYGFFFDDDKDKRDIYEVTLKRGNREFISKFGQSIAESSLNGKPKEPDAYDVLACLQKWEVGTFKDFCDEFGYDEDSRKAEKTYNAVLNEWNNIKMLYSDEEIEKLQEIN